METPVIMLKPTTVVLAEASKHRDSVCDLLETLGCKVTTVNHRQWSSAYLNRLPVMLLVLQHDRDTSAALDLATYQRDHHPLTVVVIFSDDRSIDTAVRAMRTGAFNYLVDPADRLPATRQALEEALLEAARRKHESEHAVVPLVEQLEGLATVLKRLPQGVVLIDRLGRMVHANKQAQGILDDGEGLRVADDGTLVTDSVIDAAALRSVLSIATQPADNGRHATGGALNIDRGSGQAALNLLVLPLGPVLGNPLGRRPVAAVLISDPSRRLEPAERTLRRLYGLTPAEARVAAETAQGKTPTEVAQALNIAVSTVKTHLTSVLSKTGTRRSNELVSLLLTGPALLSPRQDTEPPNDGRHDDDTPDDDR